MNSGIKVAYLIVAYMDPEQLGRLAKRLNRNADVYIHINAKNDITPFRDIIKQAEKEQKKKIYFAKKRYSVSWGGYSILSATFQLIEDALENKKYDRFVLLTGLDYPIKKDEEIFALFEENPKKEYLHVELAKGERLSQLYYTDILDCKWLHYAYYIRNLILKKLEIRLKKDYLVIDNKKAHYYGIAPKWAITGNAAQYLLKCFKAKSKVNKRFQKLYAPDDFYVGTLLMNSEFREHVVSKELFDIHFLPNNAGVRVLNESNYEELRSSECLYAKKFQSNASEKLIEMLERDAI